VLHSDRFVDAAPAEVWATLFDEGVYLGSQSTFYRLLSQAVEVRERRRQAAHPAKVKPELVANGPNTVWSWDITKLLGPAKWTYYYYLSVTWNHAGVRLFVRRCHHELRGPVHSVGELGREVAGLAASRAGVGVVAHGSIWGGHLARWTHTLAAWRSICWFVSGRASTRLPPLVPRSPCLLRNCGLARACVDRKSLCWIRVRVWRTRRCSSDWFRCGCSTTSWSKRVCGRPIRSAAAVTPRAGASTLANPGRWSRGWSGCRGSLARRSGCGCSRCSVWSRSVIG
jgi:hypothetical protein